jgi:VIT1/CCC1 family predicted Fe2+/Mn2+ transporter
VGDGRIEKESGVIGATADPRGSRRVLEPIDRISEILFGLIMVLTFTGSLSVAEAGRQDVRMMLVGALGCNIAWGIIDAILYLMGALAEKAFDLRTLRAVRAAGDPDTGRALLADALPPIVASVSQPAELDALRERIVRLPEPAKIAHLGKEHWLGALGVFLLVFLSTFPVTIPFFFLQDAVRALRISNAIAVALLFLVGFRFGRVVGRRPVPTGLVMLLLGVAIVAMTIALGG